MTETEANTNIQLDGTGDAKSKCTLCSQNFESIQDALKHELLMHSKKNLLVLNTNRKIRTVLKSMNNGEVEERRIQLRNALQQCEPGTELSTIIKARRIDVENLEIIYSRIVIALQQELRNIYGINIYPFGSIASGLALRDCDIDLYIDVCNESETIAELPQGTRESNANCQQLYNMINRSLRASKRFEEVYAIKQARVPIIKCKHISTGFSLDINVSCPSSVHNTTFLRDLVLLDTRIHELFLFLKIWSKELKLIGPGNMTSYCLITLIIFFLQQRIKEKHQWTLPSIKKLQSNTTPCMVLGVNYAYNMKNHVKTIPPQFTVMQLIGEFFTYYSNFDYENKIISPYLGTTIPINEFRNGEFTFKEYENQLHTIAVAYDTPAPLFPMYRCVHVQDPFCLNHNVARSMTTASLEYFRKCIQCAHHICSDANIQNEAKRYERLLYGIIEEMASITRMEESSLPKELIFRFTPTRAELRALTLSTKIDNNKELHTQWVQHYIEAFQEILTEIFLIDLQVATPSHRPKHERRENADNTKTWLINSSIDTWSGRLHVRNPNESFMSNQLAQTRAMQQNARTQPTCAVNLSGVLTVNIICNYTAIELKLTRQNADKDQGINKNDPLRKFFNIFKCTMQNWKLKEKLQVDCE